MIQLGADEKQLLSDVIDKHLAFLEGSARNVRNSQLTNRKRNQAISEKIANLRNIKLKVEAG